MTSSPPCPVCAHDQTRPHWRDLPDRLFRTTKARFTLQVCDACRTTFVHPLPSPQEIAGFYPEQYWLGPIDRGESVTMMTRLLGRYRRLALRDHVRFVGRAIARQRAAGIEVRLLDVGCGDGSFLDALGEPGSTGMDVSLAALREVRRRGFAAVRGTLDECPLLAGGFSLVTAFHCLEHIRPVEPALAAMKTLLRPGGEIIVQVPNADCLQARLLRSRWGGYDVPRHLVNYTARTLREVLERCGFEVLDENHHCLRDNPTALANSLVPGLSPPRRLLRDGGGGGLGGLGGVLANLTYLAVTLASTPFSMFESALGRGASVMMRARPRN